MSSQPSSSSMSSNNDDIITTGLRVQQGEPNIYRRRNLRNVTSAPSGYSSRETGSSQDEYEESESEEDRVLSSSNEEVNRQPAVNPLLSQTRAARGAASSSDDDDDNSTALGTRINASRFIPQPNVFSDPQIARNPSWTRATEPRRSGPSEISNSSHRTTIPRNSQASVRSSRLGRRPEHQQQQQHSPYNVISPSHHADHDAALRASLSTLLSCAAAARGLPKSEPQQSSPGPSRERQSSFRLVPESVAMGEGESEDESAPAATAGPQSRKHPHCGPSYLDHATPASKKRRSSSPKSRTSSHPGSSKKSRRSDYLITYNPTVMTWVLSGGAVVLFSAISFSAGYMLGKEVGRMEVDAGMGPGVGDGGLTGDAMSKQQAVKGGLKKLGWGSFGAGTGILA